MNMWLIFLRLHSDKILKTKIRFYIKLFRKPVTNTGSQIYSMRSTTGTQQSLICYEAGKYVSMLPKQLMDLV